MLTLLSSISLLMTNLQTSLVLIFPFQNVLFLKEINGQRADADGTINQKARKQLFTWQRIERKTIRDINS